MTAWSLLSLSRSCRGVLYRNLRTCVKTSTRRSYAAHSPSRDRATIPIGNNGHIAVDIYQPPQPKSPALDRPDLLLQLPSHPPGLLNAAQRKLLLRNAESLNPAAIAQKSSVPVLRPHYRVGTTHPFPTPIHDVALAYEWAVQWAQDYYQPSKPKPDTTTSNIDGDSRQLHIAVTGTSLGGTLALTLALTECRLTTPARITTVLAVDPILDWVFEADPHLRRSTARPHRPSLSEQLDHDEVTATKQALYSLRHACFHTRSPSTPFDPFASPLHFLRSPARRVPSRDAAPAPLAPDADEDPEGANDVDDETLARVVGAPALTPTTPSASGHSASDHRGVNGTSPAADPEGGGPHASTGAPKRTLPLDDPRRFKRPLRYPPAELAGCVKLPEVRVQVAPGGVLRGQSEELVRLLRRGLLRGRGFKMGRSLEKMLVDFEALRRARGEDGEGDERLELVEEGWRRFGLGEGDGEGDGDEVVVRWLCGEAW